MNRRRGPVAQKNFIPGNGYNANTPIKSKQNFQQQQNAPQRVSPQQVLSAPEDQQQPELKQQRQDTPAVENQQLQTSEEQETNNEASIVPLSENPFKDGEDMVLDTPGVVDSKGKVKFKKIFMTRKKASVRTKEKRIRQNRRLRKTIIPKNALMALNELKGVSISEFTINSNPGGGFSALVTVNNIQYEGRGNSKIVAKNSACEKALRDFIIAKMREKPRNSKGSSSNNSVCNESEPMDTSDDNTQNSKNNNLDDSDEVPMINLASFAIYKLFSEWESEGFVIPEMHPSTGGNTSDNEGSVAGKEPKKVTIRNELPQNWETMHPASLLCVMRPGITYVEKGTTGEKPHVLQSLGVTVDDQEFVASGRSKKLARRNVAALACNTLFNTNFELDIKTD